MKRNFWRARSLSFAMLCLAMSGLLFGCLHINVMGHDVPESEYRAHYDEQIARERQGLRPSEGYDEHGRRLSWDKFWCQEGGTRVVPSTARSRRLRRYIIAKRRAAGLPELTCQDE